MVVTITQHPSCSEKVHFVYDSQLPLSCPTDEMSLWNAHPKVYLTLEEGEAHCPYCGTKFILQHD